MSALKKLLAQLAAAGSAKLTPLLDPQPTFGVDHIIKFFQTDDIGGTTTKLAVSTLRPDRAEIGGDTVSETQQLLTNRKVDRRFILTYLFFDDKGSAITLFASEGSLRHFIEKHEGHLKREDIKDIFGQIMLGIHALHEKGLAHRDIGPENILITKNKKGERVVVVGDLDSIVSVDPNGKVNANSFSIAGRNNFTPELEPFIVPTKKEWVKFTPELAEAYKNINLKAADCFALGLILQELMEQAEPGEILYKDPIISLKDALLQDSPVHRMTLGNVENKSAEEKVQTGLAHPFFASTGQSNTHFFNALQERQSPYEFIGEYRIDNVEENNSFFIMKDYLKPIYQLVEKLDNQFNLFDSIGKNRIGEIIETPENVDTSISHLNANFREFHKQISLALNNNIPPAEYEILLEISKTILTKMVMLQSVYASSIDSFILTQYVNLKSNGALLEENEMSWKALLPIYLELAQFQFKNKQIIDPNILLGIIKSSVQEYSSLKTSGIKGMFSVHGDSGKLRAGELNNLIEEWKKSLLTPDQALNPGEILKLLSGFFEKNKGSGNWENSLKTIVDRNLNKIGNGPIQQLLRTTELSDVKSKIKPAKKD